jgi:chorismate synthase
MGTVRLVTAGESHGFSLLALLEGIPAGLALDPETINEQLSRLHSSYNLGDENPMVTEEDEIAILSGVRSGETLGIPIALQIENRHAGLTQTVLLHTFDKRVMGAWSTPRPGYPDLAGAIKFGYRDLRYVDERAGVRETVIRVAAGAIARKLIFNFGMQIFSHVISIGKVEAQAYPHDLEELCNLVEISSVGCADPEAANKMILALEAARREGETLGGVFEVVCTGVPIGLGSYAQWDKRIDARIAQHIFSIPGVRGFEIGDGFRCTSVSSYSAHDPLYVKKTKDKRNPAIVYRSSNHAGGLEGGVTNGSPVVFRCAVAPLPSPMKPMPSVNLQTMRPDQPPQSFGEICAVGPLRVVAESVFALVLADSMIEKFGGDSMDELKENFDAFVERLPFIVHPDPPESEM